MTDVLPQPCASTAPRSRSGGFWLAALVAAGVTGVFNVNYILAHFYRTGPGLYDAGYLGAMVYHTTPLLPIPLGVGGGGSGSWLKVHFSPILYLLSIPSNWVDLPMPAYYALTQGFIYGLLAFAGAWCSRALLESWRFGPIIAALFGLGLGFSGITLKAVEYPHFECLFCGWAILFLALLLQGKWGWAIGPFVLALLVREDCGLHLFGILFLLLGAAWIMPEWRPRRRGLAVFMVAALGYSFAVMFLQKVYFPGDNALRRVYLGDPPFHHLTSVLLGQRLEYYLYKGKFIWVPHFILLVAAMGRRSWVLLCGWAAFVPWIVLNSLAVTEAPGSLSLYYAFPLVIALIWPALTYAADPRRLPPAGAAILQAVILISSLGLLWIEHSGEVYFAMNMGFSREEFKVAGYRQSRDFVLALNRQAGRHIFDYSVTALFPTDLAWANTPQGTSVKTPDVIMGFNGGMGSNELFNLALSQGPWHQYYLSGLPLYIMSKQPLPAELRSMEGVIDTGVSTFPPNFGLTLGRESQAWREPNGAIRDEGNYAHLSFVAFGPYMPLPPGRYTVTFEIEFSAAAAGDLVVCDVATDDGKMFLKQMELTGAALSSSAQPQEVSLTFNATDPADLFEFRVQKQGAVHLLIKSYSLVRADLPPTSSGSGAGKL
jgi:hypothetical protein